MPEIQKITETHHQMMLWLIENPGKRLRDMSDHFGYSVPWLSTVINSGCFQAKLAELQGAADTLTIADIPAKLRGLTAAALDVMADHVDAASHDPSSLQHRDYVKGVVDMGLKSIGLQNPHPAAPQLPGIFAPNATFVTVSPEVYARAREKLVNQAPPLSLEDSINALPEASQLLASQECNLGSVQPARPSIFETPCANGTEAARNPV